MVPSVRRETCHSLGCFDQRSEWNRVVASPLAGFLGFPSMFHLRRSAPAIQAPGRV